MRCTSALLILACAHAVAPKPTSTSRSTSPSPSPSPSPITPTPTTADRVAVAVTVPVAVPDDPPLPSTPVSLDPRPDFRARIHIAGSPLEGDPHPWLGRPIPSFVPRRQDDLTLVLLDASPDGWLALYRELLSRDEPLLWKNGRYRVDLRGADGTVAWSLALSDLLSRADHLEVQDLRTDGGVLYFNEACQTYSRDAHGACSSLVAVDPRAGRVLWRTPPLTSNGRFLVHGDVIVCGYGFTDEPASAFLVRRSDGAIVARQRLRARPIGYTLDGDVLRVRTEGGGEATFRLVSGADGARLEPRQPARLPPSRGTGSRSARRR